MTPEETRQAAAVMLAYAEGKKIECRIIEDTDDPWDEVPGPVWDWANCIYRVAPERWSGKIWVHPDGAITRDSPSIDGTLFERHGWRLIEAKEVEP